MIPRWTVQDPSWIQRRGYVDFENLKSIVSEFVSNHRRLMDLKQRLEANDTGDTIVKILGGLAVVLETLAGILFN